MSRRIKPRHSNRCRGFAYIWIALMIVVLVGFVGLAVDTGWVVLAANQLQATADASAMAGARHAQIDVSDARSAAINVAGQNFTAGQTVTLQDNPTNISTGDVVLGFYDRGRGRFFLTLEAANSVKVTARRTASSSNGALGLLFGPTFGVNTVEIERSAIAMIGGGNGAGLVVLNRNQQCAFMIQDDATELTIIDGAVQVNSDHIEAVCHSGTPAITAEAINTKGDADINFSADVSLSGSLNPNQTPAIDPLVNLPAPVYNVGDDLGTIAVTGTGSEVVSITPGYYSGGITMTNTDGDLNLEQGIYILDGAGFDIQSGDLNADGVLIYVIGTGVVHLGGDGQLTIRSPNPGPHNFPGVSTFEGVSIFLAHDNTNAATIDGSNLDLEGTYYFPSSHLNLMGNGNVGNLVIADTTAVSGDGEMTITYDDRFPPLGNTVFLVK